MATEAREAPDILRSLEESARYESLQREHAQTLKELAEARELLRRHAQKAEKEAADEKKTEEYKLAEDAQLQQEEEQGDSKEVEREEEDEEEKEKKDEKEDQETTEMTDVMEERENTEVDGVTDDDVFAAVKRYKDSAGDTFGYQSTYKDSAREPFGNYWPTSMDSHTEGPCRMVDDAGVLDDPVLAALRRYRTGAGNSFSPAPSLSSSNVPLSSDPHHDKHDIGSHKPSQHGDEKHGHKNDESGDAPVSDVLAAFNKYWDETADGMKKKEKKRFEKYRKQIKKKRKKENPLIKESGLLSSDSSASSSTDSSQSSPSPSSAGSPPQNAKLSERKLSERTKGALESKDVSAEENMAAIRIQSLHRGNEARRERRGREARREEKNTAA